MASITEEYQKLYDQAMDAYNKNKKKVNTSAKNTSKATTTKKTNFLTKKNDSVTKESAERILANSSNINKQVANMGVAQPDYENERFAKSQTEIIAEKGKKALADRKKAFDEWYTEEKKDMLFNADGTFRDLKAELDDFKANNNAWKMTASERREYNAYKKELEAAIDHSDYLQSVEKEKTLSSQEEKNDFYLMQDAYFDTFGEKTAAKLGKVAAGIVNMPFQAYDTVKDFVDPNFDINNPNNVSNIIADASNRAEEEIQYGSGALEQFALNTIEGVSDFGAHLLLGMATGTSPLVGMAAKSGLSKYSQNRKEGYDESTSLGNAILTGTMTMLTEKIGLDNFTNIVSSGVGQFAISALVSQSLSEGAEEGLEYLAEPIIDFATLGKNVDYKAGELFMSVALGMSSGGVIGSAGSIASNTISNVKTRKGANQLKADMQVLMDYANQNTLTDIEANAVNDVLRVGQTVLDKFESTSVIKDAVQLSSDQVQPRSVAEIVQNFNSFLQPEIDAETKTYTERMAMYNIINNSQQLLNQKGIRMDAVQYSNLNEDVRKQVDKTQKFANDLKVNLRFDSQANVKGKKIDGYYDNKTGEIVVNPEGERPALSTFVHELTHGTESSKTYSKLQELIEKSVGSENFKSKVSDVKERYSEVVNLTDEGAAQEYVAIYLQDTLGKEDFVKRLVKYDTSLASRIYEKVKRLVSTTDTGQDIEYTFMKAFRDSDISEQDIKQYAFYEDNIEKGLTTIIEPTLGNGLFEKYTLKEIQRFKDSKKIFIDGYNANFEDFIKDSLDEEKMRENNQEILFIGKVGEKLNNKILKENNNSKSLLTYNVAFENWRIRHVIKSHNEFENEELRGQRRIKEEDLKKIPKILTDDKTKINHLGKDKNGNDTYEFVYKEDNKTYNVLEFVSNKQHILSLATMYINEKKPSTTSKSPNGASDQTSMTGSGTVSNNNIQNNSKNNKYPPANSSKDLASMKTFEKVREQRRVLNEIESKDISLLDKSIEILTYLHENKANMTTSGIKRFEDTINAHGAGFDTSNEYQYYRDLSYENTSVEELEVMLEEHRKLEMNYSLSGGMQMNKSNLTRERYIIDRINDEINKAKNEELELKGRKTFEEKPLTTEQQLMINRLGNIEYKMLNGRYHVEAYNKNGNTEVNSSYDPDYLVKKFGTKIANQIITTATSRSNKITEFDTDTSFMTDEYVNKIVNKAKRGYGTTTNPTEAGYMTLDGKWLDFSGKKDGGPSNVRNMDHVEIDIDGVDSIDFIKMGNIRLQPEVNGFQLLKEPTEQQKKSLIKYLSSVHGNDEGYFIGFVDENRVWNTVDSLEFDMKTSPKTIMNAIDEHFKNKNRQYSIGLTKDSLGKNLTEEQKNYFANTKVKDENGNLQVMYRGGNEEINVFDNRKSKPSNLYGRGFYFTKEESHASQYGQARPYYLNIENPLSPDSRNISKEQLVNFLQAIEDDGEDYDLSNYGYGATPKSIANEIYGKSDFEMLQDISASSIGDLVYTTKWFNEVNDTNYDGFILPTETVVFDSNQIKNVDNATPTKNPDVRYSIGLSPKDLSQVETSKNIVSKKLSQYGDTITLQDIESDQEIMESLNKVEKISKSIPETINDNSPKRLQVRENIVNRYIEEQVLGKSQNKVVSIILGPPGSGKSSVIAKELLQKYNAVELDSDIVKAMTPEFEKHGGIYANAVHEESAKLAETIKKYIIDNGYNFVYPLVGKNSHKIANTIEDLTKKGYTISVYDVSLPSEKSIVRAVNRFIHTGRYLPIEYLKSVGDLPDKTYDAVKHLEGVMEYARYSNDVKHGEKAILLEQGRNGQINERLRETSEEIYGVRQTTSGNERLREGREFHLHGGLNSNEQADDGLFFHDQALEKYGAFKPGEIPSRNVEIAQETDYGKTNRFTRTMGESEALNDDQVDLLKAKIGKGEFAYEPVSNEKQVNDANFKIEKLGLEKSIESYLEGDYSSRNIALGQVLLNQLGRSGDTKTAMKVASKLATDLTEAGRAVQSARILKRLTPEGQLIHTERTINKLQESLNKRYGKKAPQLEINDELKVRLLNSKNETEMNQILEEISVEVAKQIPSTLMDKLNTWRYLAMLGNPRTHVRNTVGNAMFYPLVTMKNNIGTVLEATAQKAGKLNERTKTTLNPFNESDKALIEFGKQNYEEYKKTLEKTGGKYDLAELVEKNRDIYSNDNVFGKTLNKLVKKNSDLLKAEDILFSKQRYSSSLAQYMKANNLTTNDVESKEFIKAQEYAYKEARKQTFQDQNKIAEAIGKFAKTNKVTQLAVDSIIPFKSTPLNIVRRGVEYSPIGLLTSITKGSTDLKNGKITVNEYIDKVSSGLTGTGVTLLGALLVSMGLFRTRDDDKDRKQQMDNDLGEQDYALTFPHGTYTFDWASPLIMPLAIGAELYNGVDSFESIDDLVTVATKITEPIFETSMLSGVTSSLQSYSSGVEGAFNMLQNSMASYVNQYFPTLFGQIARSIDDTRRTTYPNTGVVDKTGKQIKNKIPGLSYMNEPYINTKGEEQKQEGSNMFGRMFLNMLSPGYYKSKTSDKYDDELYRLYNNDASNIGVLPSTATKKVTNGSETYKLLDEDYTNFNQTRYSLEREFTNTFIDSEVYDTLTDAERVTVISKMREYAGKEAKNQYLTGINQTYDDSEYAKAKGAIDSGIPLHDYYLSKNYYSNLSGDSKKSDYIDYLIDSGYDGKAMNYLYDMQYGDSKMTNNINSYASSENLEDGLLFEVKDTVATASGVKGEDGSTVKNSKALEVRKELDDLGLYESYVKYVAENNLEPSSMGLNKSVVKMSNEEFEKEYESIFGKSYEAKTDEEMMSAYSKAMSSSKSNKSKKSTDKTAAKIKKIDAIIQNARKSSVASGDNKVDAILKKLKSSSTTSAKTSNSDLLKKYLKEHAYDAALLG